MKYSDLLKDGPIIGGAIIALALDIVAIYLAFSDKSMFIWIPLLFLGYGIMKMTSSRIRMLMGDKKSK